MKTIIAGTRTITDYELVKEYIKSANLEITEVVCGTAAGVDTLGERYANEIGVPVKKFPADWNKHGKAAGHIRNRQMAEYADALILIWDGKSKGSKNMYKTAQELDLVLRVRYHTDNMFWM